MSADLRILIIKEGDMFVGQCLEHDVCAQARTLEQLERRMDAQLEAERLAGLNSTGTDYGHIDPAPEEFHNMWETARAIEAAEPGRKMALMAA